MKSSIRVLYESNDEERGDVYQMDHLNFYKVGVSEFLFNTHSLKLKQRAQLLQQKLIDFVKIRGACHWRKVSFHCQGTNMGMHSHREFHAWDYACRVESTYWWLTVKWFSSRYLKHWPPFIVNSVISANQDNSTAGCTWITVMWLSWVYSSLLLDLV